MFRRPGEDSDEEGEDDDDIGPMPVAEANGLTTVDEPVVRVVDAPRITIIEDD